MAKTAEGKARLGAVEQRLAEAMAEVVERDEEKDKREREEACPPTKTRRIPPDGGTKRHKSSTHEAS